ncbi:MAG: FAD-dependent oxidoreductase [Chitinispirillaceae bacterium]|nr:FAD-dependent oxidoreductase [Chitinispirillaceae bacterium]
MKSHYNHIIIGAGLSGLSAGYFLQASGQKDFVVIEKELRPGGLCRTERKGGFLFDRCGHLLHFDSDKMKRLVKNLLGGNLCTHTRNSKIYSFGRLTGYPFQCNLYGLPASVVVECIEGFVRARFEKPLHTDDTSFASWVVNHFGEGIARHFMLPYNEKLWVIDPYKLTTEWMGHYVPSTDLHCLLSGALQPMASESGYNARFQYPKTGGIESLIRALADKVGDSIVPRKDVAAVNPKLRTVTTADGMELTYDTLITTMPLKLLISRMQEVPTEIRKLNSTLKCSGVYNINLAVKGASPDGISWIYYPEKEYPFYRIGFYSSFAPENCLEGTTSLYAEIAYRYHTPDRQALLDKSVRRLGKLGIIKSPDDIIERCLLDLPFAYVTYDKHWKHARRSIIAWLKAQGIYSIGRYGAWEYSDMETSMLQACSTVETICR